VKEIILTKSTSLRLVADNDKGNDILGKIITNMPRGMGKAKTRCLRLFYSATLPKKYEWKIFYLGIPNQKNPEAI
jgi:hypothetical protein